MIVATTALVAGSIRTTVSSPFATHTASAVTMIPLGRGCPVGTAVEVFVAGSILKTFCPAALLSPTQIASLAIPKFVG